MEPTLADHVQQTIDLLTMAERARSFATAQINRGADPGDLSVISKSKFTFDDWASPLIPLAESLGINAAGLDQFIRTGNSDLVEPVFRVLRQLQGVLLQQAAKKTGPKTLQTRTEANLKARDYLKDHPKSTSRELASAVGCSKGLAIQLPAWRAVKEERDKGRQPRKAKVVRLSDKMDRVTGIEDDPLEKLIASQEADEEASPLNGFPRRGRVYVKR